MSSPIRVLPNKGVWMVVLAPDTSPVGFIAVRSTQADAEAIAGQARSRPADLGSESEVSFQVSKGDPGFPRTVMSYEDRSGQTQVLNWHASETSKPARTTATDGIVIEGEGLTSQIARWGGTP